MIKNIILEELDLRYNNLYCNHLDSEGIRFIAEALTNNITLRVLNLCNNDIGFKGIRFISEALTKNTSLQVLNLHLNNEQQIIIDTLLENKGLDKIYGIIGVEEIMSP